MKEIWKDLSRTCFSCGTCNIVCPTCYCFDVQDNWNLDQVVWNADPGVGRLPHGGLRQVSLGAGACAEFPRGAVRAVLRHRLMRKTAYLNKKLGGPACVGCGRCGAGCVPDIADPVRTITRILEG